jgi:hypothetical protein
MTGYGEFDENLFIGILQEMFGDNPDTPMTWMKVLQYALKEQDRLTVADLQELKIDVLSFHVSALVGLNLVDECLLKIIESLYQHNLDASHSLCRERLLSGDSPLSEYLRPAAYPYYMDLKWKKQILEYLSQQK